MVLSLIAPDRRSRRRALLVVVIGMMLVAVAGCRREPRPRVLLIGIDGASFVVATPLMKEGRLPNLEKIARQGVHGPLRSQQPLMSPRIWNSIATGKTAAKHGIRGFARRDESGRQRLFASTDRRCHALWNIVSDAGLHVAVINWWNTYPPERINGVMISDHLLAREIEGRRRMTQAEEEATGPVVFPPVWSSRAAEVVRSGSPPIPFVDPFGRGLRLPHWLEREPLSRRYRQDGALTRIALEIDAAEKPDVLMLLLTGVDRVSHFLWGNIEPAEVYPRHLRPNAAEREGGARALRLYYEYTDALIGALLERYRRDDLVVIVSDHGFESGKSYGGLTGTHHSEKALDGVFFARGRGIEAGGKVEGLDIFDVTPAILAWLGLPVARDMDGSADEIVMPGAEPIDSYDTGPPIEWITESPSGADRARLEELRSLGYIE